MKIVKIGILFLGVFMMILGNRERLFSMDSAKNTKKGGDIKNPE